MAFLRALEVLLAEFHKCFLDMRKWAPGLEGVDGLAVAELATCGDRTHGVEIDSKLFPKDTIA